MYIKLAYKKQTNKNIYLKRRYCPHFFIVENVSTDRACPNDDHQHVLFFAFYKNCIFCTQNEIKYISTIRRKCAKVYLPPKELF